MFRLIGEVVISIGKVVVKPSGMCFIVSGVSLLIFANWIGLLVFLVAGGVLAVTGH